MQNWHLEEIISHEQKAKTSQEAPPALDQRLGDEYDADEDLLA